MRSYLKSFFHINQYSDDDAVVLLETYDLIVACKETQDMWEQAIRLYSESINCDYAKILELADLVATKLNIHEYTTELLIFICLSSITEKEYEKRGIDKKLFYNSMLDLKYKLEECKLVKGIVGSFVAPWFVGFFNLTRFALGRLQFEIVKFGRTFEKNGKVLTPDSNCINVHIPRTMTPLDEKSCDCAFEMARQFFADKTGNVCAFLCDSWLLYPEHEKMLSHSSNVYRFMKRFEIINWGFDKDRVNLWRLFDTEEKNPDRLPADTSMRKAYIKHLKNGGKMGTGCGIFFAK